MEFTSASNLVSFTWGQMFWFQGTIRINCEKYLVMSEAPKYQDHSETYFTKFKWEPDSFALLLTPLCAVIRFLLTVTAEYESFIFLINLQILHGTKTQLQDRAWSCSWWWFLVSALQEWLEAIIAHELYLSQKEIKAYSVVHMKMTYPLTHAFLFWKHFVAKGYIFKTYNDGIFNLVRDN